MRAAALKAHLGTKEPLLCVLAGSFTHASPLRAPHYPDVARVMALASSLVVNPVAHWKWSGPHTATNRLAL